MMNVLQKSVTGFSILTLWIACIKWYGSQYWHQSGITKYGDRWRLQMNVAQLGDRGLTDVMAVAMCDSHVTRLEVVECVHTVQQWCVWVRCVWELNEMWWWHEVLWGRYSDPEVRLLLQCNERQDVMRCNAVTMQSPLSQIFWSWGEAATSV